MKIETKNRTIYITWVPKKEGRKKPFIGKMKMAHKNFVIGPLVVYWY